MTPTTCDVLIIGAGMAGVSAAAHLAPHMRVVLTEREAQPAYHATGRSAAMYTQTYSNDLARALTAASRDFLHDPPDGFSDSALLVPRGVMMAATPELGHIKVNIADHARHGVGPLGGTSEVANVPRHDR